MTDADPVDDPGEAPDTAPEVVSDAEHRDELPEDLDAHGMVGPYLFPNNSRRRIPAVLYAVIGLWCIAWYGLFGDGGVLVNEGVLAAGIVLLLLAAYSWQAGWDLACDEQEALVAATRAVGFPVGHASAQLGWRGLRSRPTWRILLYSNEPSPERRGLVLVDGVDGSIVDTYVEHNPEDWSAFTA